MRWRKKQSKQMKSIVIYIRTSTTEQNPQNQLADCLTLLKTNEDYELVEEKQSAYKDNKRVEFEAIKTAIKKGEVKSLNVWDWDRLFRNRKKLVEFFSFCNFYKCEIHSFRQAFFEELYKIPEPFNEVMQNLTINLLGWLSQDESDKKSRRTKNAIRISDTGVTQSYKGNKWGRKTILSERLKQVVLDLRSKGLSIRQIQNNPEVYYYDKNRNKARVSIATLHSIIKELNRV